VTFIAPWRRGSPLLLRLATACRLRAGGEADRLLKKPATLRKESRKKKEDRIAEGFFFFLLSSSFFLLSPWSFFFGQACS
jgi:hypothetical protein